MSTRRHRVALGVLTAAKAGDSRPLGAQTISYKKLARIGRHKGVRVIVFHPQDLGPGRRLYGYVYHPRERTWRRVVAPWPDIVYNRVPRRSIEGRSDVQGALRRLARAGIPVFNPGFLDKWQITEVLSQDPVVSPHVPPTRPVQRLDDVGVALAEWGAVFLKPVGGSLGRGIIYVYPSRRGYGYHAFLHGRYRRGWQPNWRRLSHLIGYAVRSQSYIVQQAIERLEYRGNPFDVRCLLQKDGGGDWRVNGMTVRVAGVGRVLTHVPRGGAGADLIEVLQAVFADQDRIGQVVNQLYRCAKSAAMTIDRHQEGLFAELSADITLDVAGWPWILECNAKPARFDEPYIQIRQLHGVIDFALGAVATLGANQPP